MGWFETLEPAALAVIRLIVLESLYVVPIFVVVGVASWFFRGRGPGLHLALWSLVLLRLVLPPDLTHSFSVGRLWADLVAPRAVPRFTPPQLVSSVVFWSITRARPPGGS